LESEYLKKILPLSVLAKAEDIEVVCVFVLVLNQTDKVEFLNSALNRELHLKTGWDKHRHLFSCITNGL